jgi:hypothetical protein
MPADLKEIQPKPQKLVLAQYIEHVKRDLEGRNPYWHAPNFWDRWLVRLDCGCITEALTRQNYGPPTEQKCSETLGGDDAPLYKQTHIMHPYQFEDGRPGSICMFNGPHGKPFPGPGGCCKAKGTMWCSGHDNKPPWREVVQYIARETRPGEPGEPPLCWWDVILSCGHCYGPNGADPEWSPGVPPYLDQQKIAHLERAIQRWDGPDREELDRQAAGKGWRSTDETIRWHREQIDHKGFMVCSPAMEEECPKCACLRQIVEYRLIGPLSDKPWKPPAKLEPKPQPTAEEIKERKLRRLKRVESELTRLQKEADQLRRETGE